MTLDETRAMSIHEIEWSVRAEHVLDYYLPRVTTLGHLASMRESELKKVRNCGRKTINEIREKLGELGLALGEPNFQNEVERAIYRVKHMDAIDGAKDRKLSTILAALEAGLRKPRTGGQYDAYVMLQEVVNANHDS